MHLKYKVKTSLLIILLINTIKNVLSVDQYAIIDSSFTSGKNDFFWNEALNVMSYHRTKMNEYLCKNYVANEIVENFRNRSFDKRTGSVKKSRLVRDSLLEDQGSQKYQDWLSRSSTLEDIYRQFEHSEGGHGGGHHGGGHHEAEDEHEGEVTGYALVGHKHQKPIEYEGDGHYLSPHSHISHSYYEEEEEHEDKGMKLKELFHFALTAIAFLAFACFMIEVIMCLMEAPPTEPDYVLVPTTTGETGPASKSESNTTNFHREERSLHENPISLETLNNISSKVLSSIEALAVIYEDDGECLKRVLCQSNKYSKSLPDIQKIWIPIWSFGTSWIAARLLSKKQSSSEGINTLKYLKASVMGLSNRECHVLYPKCDGKAEKRRKKRTVK